jgi:hypothetical protein
MWGVFLPDTEPSRRHGEPRSDALQWSGMPGSKARGHVLVLTLSAASIQDIVRTDT